jgi:hypothetical protein
MALVTTSVALLLALVNQSDEVPADRYMAMTVGISADLRLASSVGKGRLRYDANMSDVDDQQLVTEGFKCVRYVISPSELMTGSPDGALDPKRVEAMLKVVETAERSGLAVILAPHFERQDLLTASATLGRLAAALGKTDVDSTFLEICADPIGMDSPGWQIVQESWMDSIRQNLPRHTIIVRAAGKDGPADLTQLPALNDRNVVYAFQFFDPESFTNQCLPGSPIQESDKVTLPYPSSAAVIVPVISGLADSQKDWAMRYAREQWNLDKLTDMIHPVGDWARSKKVRVICDAFGVSQKVAAADRAKYLQDVKSALVDAGIGWTLSEYVGDRGIYSGVPSLRVADSGILGALGLGG